MYRRASNESRSSSSSSSSSDQPQQNASNTEQAAPFQTPVVQVQSETGSANQYTQKSGAHYISSLQAGSTHTGQASYTSVAATTTYQSGQYHTTSMIPHQIQTLPASGPTAITQSVTSGGVSHHPSGVQYTTTATQVNPSGSIHSSVGAGSSQVHYLSGGVSQPVYHTSEVTQSSLPVGGSTASRGQSVLTETSRVVGVEYGEQRVISVSQRVDESRQCILSERYVEHEIKVPKKIVREELIEKVVIVPEKIIHEEIVDEVQKVREKIVEIARPTIIEKVIEVPEIEIVERIVEVPEKVVKEKIREEVKIQYQERIVEVPKVIVQEKIVEVPEVHYRDIPVEKIVEVPEYVEQIVYQDVAVPQYVDKPVPNYVTVEVPVNVERKVPVPVEAEVTFEYRIPQLKAAYGRVSYPVYLPRFIEVPIAAELLNEALTRSAQQYMGQVQQLTKAATSLCEIEGLATNIMKTDFQTQLASVDLQSAVLKAWQSNLINVDGPAALVQPTNGVLFEGASQAGPSVSGQTYTTVREVQHPVVSAVHSTSLSTPAVTTAVCSTPAGAAVPVPTVQQSVLSSTTKKSKKSSHKNGKHH